MTDNKYNGWTNYETWRVNLEIFDGFDPFDNFSDDQANMMDWLADALKEYAETLIYEAGGGDGNIAVDYALAFLQAVNWREIAQHMFLDYADDEDVAAYKEATA
jgi:hypothetical protein